MSKFYVIIAFVFIFVLGCAPESGQEAAAPSSREDTVVKESAIVATTEAGGGGTIVGQPIAPVTVDLGQLSPEPIEEGELMIKPQPGVPNPLASLTQRVSLDLSQRLNMDVSEVEVVRTETVEWSDGSLGCPQPGMNYIMVITPGYRIVLKAQGQEYSYHTDRGSSFILCQSNRPAEQPDR